MKMVDLVAVTKGRKPPTTRLVPDPGDLRLLQIEDLRDDATPRYSPPPERPVVATPEDVVLAWDGANAGTSSFGLSGLVGSTLAVLRPRDPGTVYTPYLGYFLKSQESFLRATCKGATVPHIDPQALGQMRVPLPSLSVQRAIADTLGQVDALEAKHRTSLALVRELGRAVFLEMFGDLRGPCTHVKDIASSAQGSVRTGPFGSQLLHSEFVDEGVAVLGIDNVVTNEFSWGSRRFITSEKYQELMRYTVRPGDVLITIMGTCGRCVVVPDDIPLSITTKHLCAITVDRSLVLPEFVRACFLWHPLSRQFLLSRAKGAIMDGLNMGIVKAMPLPLPALDDQHAFVDRLQAIEPLMVTADRSSELLGELRLSLEASSFADHG